MYEDLTYESILERMLQFIRQQDRSLDTREGSVSWYGSAPSAVEFQNLYLALDNVLNQTYPDTASRPYLIRRAKDRLLSPYPASPAVLELTITPAGLTLPEGTRFSIGELNYAATQNMGEGRYQITCETPGAALLIPGEDEEDTEAFRQRYFDSLEAQAFGGNRADYLEKVNAIPGVGGVRIHRAWNGGIRPAELLPPEGATDWLAKLSAPAEILSWLHSLYAAAASRKLTVGGTVRLTLIDSTFSPPSAALLERVQTAIDPTQNAGEGYGLAPVGHVVWVTGVRSAQVDLTFQMAYSGGWRWEDVQPAARQAVQAYFLELAQSWARDDGQNQPLVVRVSQIESRLLDLEGVLDVAGTRINGQAANLTLEADQIPALGSFAPDGVPPSSQEG